MRENLSNINTTVLSLATQKFFSLRFQKRSVFTCSAQSSIMTENAVGIMANRLLTLNVIGTILGECSITLLCWSEN